MYCRKRDVHFNFAGRQFKVGGALVCVDPHDSERACQPVHPNPLAYVRIPHPINDAISVQN
jgi:hypothetical protein